MVVIMEDDEDDVVPDDETVLAVDPAVVVVADAAWLPIPPLIVEANFDDNLLCFELYAMPSVLLRRNVKMNAKCVGSRSMKIAPDDSSSPLASALAQYSASTGDAWSVLCSVGNSFPPTFNLIRRSPCP